MLIKKKVDLSTVVFYEQVTNKILGKIYVDGGIYCASYGIKFEEFVNLESSENWIMNEYNTDPLKTKELLKG